ncbi:MAG: DUF131 domain-containing protein [Methanosarcinaceae archaeon]|nr:DUF131 domain-containing protein [Methanosarcinaceae archaeon]MDD4750036.1 DUF131 domain-containing protein [Methanosarcinaceae archaeon]
MFGAFFEKNSSFESEAAWKKPFENNSEIRGGGVIMLGPIPLIFGSDGESAKSAIILALLLTGLAFFFFR